MTGVPANLLAPEAGAPLRAWAPGFDAARREIRLSVDGRGGRGWRAAEARGQIFGYVSDAALKGHLAKRWVAGNNIGFGADDVQHDICGQIAAQLGQPLAHVGKRLGIGDAVAEDASVGTAIVQTGYGAETLLAGCRREESA